MNEIKKLNGKEIIAKIEADLLSTLFKYAIPFIGKRLKTTKKPQQIKTNLEDIVKNQNLLLRNLDKKIKSSRSTLIDSDSFFYSLNLRRQKSNSDKNSKYSLSINYEEDQAKNNIKISIKKDGKYAYSSEVTNNKETRDKIAPYSIKLIYENSYGEEILTITYKQQLKSYRQQHLESKEDMTNRVPLKWLNILPESLMGGVLGFTYIGDGSMGRRADLTGKTARMVDIHESIHTPDEYETRVLTSWIMEKIKSKYVR